ncbi:MAG: hypothetical protein QXP53_00355 [Candidatus Pacearchaeota archaeon]
MSDFKSKHLIINRSRMYPSAVYQLTGQRLAYIISTYFNKKRIVAVVSKCEGELGKEQIESLVLGRDNKCETIVYDKEQTSFEITLERSVDGMTSMEFFSELSSRGVPGELSEALYRVAHFINS